MNGYGRDLNGKRLGWTGTLRRRFCVMRGRWPVSMPCLPTGLIAGLAAAFVLTSWAQSQAQPKVYVVNYPLQYFAERIAGDQVSVVFPAPPDGDPAFWNPDVETIAAFQAADLILVNGATYAKWLKTASLPKSKMVDTSRSFAADYIEIKDDAVHSHGPEGEHSHAGTGLHNLARPSPGGAASRSGPARVEPATAGSPGHLRATLRRTRARAANPGRTPEFPGSAAARATVACLASRLPVFRQALRLESAERAVGSPT